MMTDFYTKDSSDDDELPDLGNFSQQKWKTSDQTVVNLVDSDEDEVKLESTLTKFKYDSSKMMVDIDIAHNEKIETALKKKVPKTADEKRQEKEEQKRLKALEKQKKAEQLQKEKEEKAKMRHVNKMMVDKNETIQEMVLEIDSRLGDEKISEIMNRFRQLGTEVLVRHHAVAGTICWKRKCTKTWNDSSNCFVPCPAYRFDEKFVLKVLGGQQLANLVKSNTLESDFRNTQRSFPGKMVLYIVEGMNSYYHKRKQAVGKSFKEGNLYSDIGPDKDSITRAVIKVHCKKLGHLCLLEKDDLLGEWLITYTKTISIGPYQKYTRAEELQFSVEDLGPSGKTHLETWERMLEQINGITPAVAKCISRYYPSFTSLFNKLLDLPGTEGSPKLEDTMLTNNRRLGPALAEKIKTILLSNDGDKKLCN